MRDRMLCAALLLMLAACAAERKPAAPAPAPSAPQPDASYDWHVLLLAPFGSILKEVPFKMHEVLLFKDQGSGGVDGGECYALEQPPPTFLKRTPAQFFLCFKHDHLASIEAVVMLANDEVPELLNSACALWHRNAGDEAPWAAPPCAGSDGTVHYEAQLEEEEDGQLPLNLKLEQVVPGES